ncbi:MAG: hypothetical protein K0R65_2068 [Crocinitomicaceae bacterium]|jgi:Ca-activated chloride channel family protein|nr:hypothetical protein [Crocinitomicaceae bacterium]
MRLSIFLLLMFSKLSFAQLVFEQTEINLGDLKSDSQRYADIEVKNTGAKKEYFLSFRRPPELVSLSKGESVMPDSMSFIRIQVNPKKKGKFEYELQVFTSDKQEATIIRVKGNFLELPDDAMAQLQNCPDFNSKPASRNPQNTVVIKTVDANFKNPVDADVFLVRNGTDIDRFKTKDGETEEKMDIGYVYFFVVSESYKSLDTSTYVSVKSKEVVLELQKDPSYKTRTAIILEDTLNKEEERAEIEIKVNEPKSDMRLDLAHELDQQQATSDQTPPAIALDSIPLNEFREEHFKPVNVVFVLDVSSSMGSNEKFDLLKFSLIQLSDLLRPQDRITLVTYASEAKVLLPAASGVEKETIRKEIKKLHASGQTAGTDGIKLGFREAEKSFISDGSNLVIVITDGAFNKSSGDYLKVIEKYNEKNILFSVVGIKNLPKDEISMREAADKGKGAYVPVFKLADAQQNLIREIRRVTFKGV